MKRSKRDFGLPNHSKYDAPIIAVLAGRQCRDFQKEVETLSFELTYARGRMRGKKSYLNRQSNFGCAPGFDTSLPLAHIDAMTICLAGDVERFLEDQVRKGVCEDAGELVNDIVRALREQQQKPFEVTPELEAWLLKSADQPATALTNADFQNIRERVRSRVPSPE